jgi:hypothetical protein
MRLRFCPRARAKIQRGPHQTRQREERRDQMRASHRGLTFHLLQARMHHQPAQRPLQPDQRQQREQAQVYPAGIRRRTQNHAKGSAPPCR